MIFFKYSLLEATSTNVSNSFALFPDVTTTLSFSKFDCSSLYEWLKAACSCSSQINSDGVDGDEDEDGGSNEYDPNGNNDSIDRDSSDDILQVLTM